MSLSGPFFIHMGFDMYSRHFLSHFHYETKFSHVRHTYFFQSAVNVYILLKQATFNTKGSQMLNVFPTFQHNSSTPSICLHQDIRAVNCISCLKSCFLFTSYISPNSEKVQSLFLHILPGPGRGLYSVIFGWICGRRYGYWDEKWNQQTQFKFQPRLLHLYHINTDLKGMNPSLPHLCIHTLHL